MMKNPMMKKLAAWAITAVVWLVLIKIWPKLFLLLTIAAIAAVIVVLFAFQSKPSKQKQKEKPAASQPCGAALAAAQAKKEIANTRPKALRKQMKDLNSQAVRMEEKSRLLDQNLKDYFGDSVISYLKFARTTDSVGQVFLENTRRILKQVELFDEEGYRHLLIKQQQDSDAMIPYRQSMEAVDAQIKENEKILDAMDKLLLEVNHLSASAVPISELPAMQEIAQLAEQTNLYQQKL